MLTRIAPTPSGYLHAGNVVNALLTSWWARSRGLTLALRVDDHDAERYRSTYASDIFRVLSLLDIEWTVGPRSLEDLEMRHSQRSRYEYFRTELLLARERGLPVFRCACSRSTARMGSTCTCRSMQHELPAESAIKVDSQRFTGGIDAIGDVVLWTKNDAPSYQLVSLVTDRDLGVTHILRGEDLAPSSAIQIQLAPFFGAKNVAKALYLHHPLVEDNLGVKLSKSAGAQGQPLVINREESVELARLATQIGASMGFISPPPQTGSE